MPLPRNFEGGEVLQSSDLYKVYSAADGDLAVDIDLRLDYPGWTTALPARLPRLILYTGGVLVTQLEQGSNVTNPGAFANFQHADAPAKIIAAGTTASFVKVWW